MAVALALPIYSWTKFFSHIANTKFFDANPLVGMIVAILIASPIIIVYIFTCVDWARGRD
jgi:hypothetical protein